MDVLPEPGPEGAAPGSRGRQLPDRFACTASDVVQGHARHQLLPLPHVSPVLSPSPAQHGQGNQGTDPVLLATGWASSMQGPLVLPWGFLPFHLGVFQVSIWCL